MYKDQLERAVDLAYARGYDAGKWDTADSIFKDLDQILMNTYSDTYGSWKGIDRELADLKEKYGIKEHQHNPAASGYYVEPRGEWTVSGYRVEEK